MVYAEERTIRAQFLSRYSQVDGLQEHIGRGLGLRFRGGRPMTERKETDLLHVPSPEVISSINKPRAGACLAHVDRIG